MTYAIGYLDGNYHLMKLDRGKYDLASDEIWYSVAQLPDLSDAQELLRELNQ